MTDLFRKTIIPWLFKWEGTSYENDPDDPGGATKFGIDKRSHPSLNIKNLTAEQATEIYWDEYWVRWKCDDFPFPMNWVWFDTCVNCGIGRSLKCLPSGYGLTRTLAYSSNPDARKHKAEWVGKAKATSPSAFLDQRDAFYRRLAESRPSSQKYLKGWLNRTEDLRKTLHI